MPSNHLFSLGEPEPEALNLELTAADTPVQPLLDVLLGPGWDPQPVPDGSFDVFPPEGAALTTAEAWEATWKLRADPRIAFAEPLFLTTDAVEVHRSPPASEPDRDEESFGSDSDTAPPYDWSIQQVEAEAAWALTPPTEDGKRLGEGIVVGHPDSGYHRHLELGERVLVARGHDFVDHDADAHDVGGAHGLGTASVIMSADNRSSKPRSITGVAPLAKLVPYRVTKKHLGIPSPVLFRKGARRLRDAIWAARREGCHVISISLGWLRMRSLHRAVQAAVDSDIILIAAAGNYTGPLVIWPGAYPESICLAGCDVQRQPWSGSARGRKVDFSGPAKDVWRAVPGDDIGPGSGTSFAVATTAGIAALWLAYHGRDNLIAKYRPHNIRLQDVFRRVLTLSSDDPPVMDGRWGLGIVNARKCLQQQLPNPAFFLAESFGPTTDTADSGWSAILQTFPELSEAEVETRVARILRISSADVRAACAGVEDEILHHLITHASLRDVMLETTSDVMNLDVESFGGTDSRVELPTLSNRLHRHLDSSTLEDNHA